MSSVVAVLSFCSILRLRTLVACALPPWPLLINAEAEELYSFEISYLSS